MAKHFNYYDGYDSVLLECPMCHWKGYFEQGSVGYFDEFKDCHCPQCGVLDAPMLAMVMYPTLQEMLDSGRPDTVAEAQRLIDKRKAFWAVALTKKDQLPAIPGNTRLDLTWDFVAHDDGRNETVIRNENQILFSEPASWEAIDNRYEDTCMILKEKYGNRLVDVVPTKRSELYLYGDMTSDVHPRERNRDRAFKRAKGDTQS